jgi:hypothetical protein
LAPLRLPGRFVPAAMRPPFAARRTTRAWPPATANGCSRRSRGLTSTQSARARVLTWGSAERAHPWPEEDGNVQGDKSDDHCARDDDEPRDPGRHRVAVISHLLTTPLARCWADGRNNDVVESGDVIEFYPEGTVTHWRRARRFRHHGG